MGKGGTLTLSEKPRWTRAEGLKVGEDFAVDSQQRGGGKMLIRRESLKLRQPCMMVLPPALRRV